jgi:hypothetical protein
LIWNSAHALSRRNYPAAARVDGGAPNRRLSREEFLYVSVSALTFFTYSSIFFRLLPFTYPANMFNLGNKDKAWLMNYSPCLSLMMICYVSNLIQILGCVLYQTVLTVVFSFRAKLRPHLDIAELELFSSFALINLRGA